MIIYLRTPRNSDHDCIECDKYDTISDLKKIIYKKKHIDPIFQMLIFSGRIMKSSYIINEYIKSYDNPMVYLRVNHNLMGELMLKSCQRKLEFSKLFHKRLNNELIDEYFVNAFIEYFQEIDLSKQIYKYELLNQLNNQNCDKKIFQ
jgi:hypothetical protein